MKDIQLLDKTRQIEKLLRDNRKAKVSFVDICAILSDVLSSNTLVLSRKGKVLGKGQIKSVPELREYMDVDTGSFINETFNNRLLSVLSRRSCGQMFRHGDAGFHRRRPAWHADALP